MRKLTNQEFIDKVRDLVSEEYIFTETYVNSRTKIKCVHNLCSHEWSIKPADFLNGIRCPSCSDLRKKPDDFSKEISNLVGNEYTFIEEYVNRATKIKCVHNLCSHEWSITPNNFLRGQRCPECKDKPVPPKTDTQFKDDVFKLVGDEYSFTETYINSSTKIKCIHNMQDCNYVWKIEPTEFLRGSRCPSCNKNSSAPSRDVERILKDMSIAYEKEKTFDSCVSVKKLRFDFYFEINNKLYCIEYDGEQHFIAIEKFGGAAGLIETKRRDDIKTNFCIENNIDLLRLTYKDKQSDFKMLITKFINKRSTTIPQGSRDKCLDTIDPQK